MELTWPYEGATPPGAGITRFTQPASNICLDFHGDPRVAQLVLFSDGNHHMALEEVLALFRARHPQVDDIFYATTPPRVIVDALKSGALLLGNLKLSVTPHVFISPVPVLERLREGGYLQEHKPFASSRGSVMLVRKRNTKRILGAEDLAREDVRIFLSNPTSESLSYEAYSTTLRRISASAGLDFGFLDLPPGASPRVVHGDCIHHREAPQCLADDRADVAIVFYHLALRYVRIFPDLFDFVPLTAEGDSSQAVNAVHIALVRNGGAWGERLIEFMRGDAAAAVYKHHGLIPVR
jgi:hypothetical protein